MLADRLYAAGRMKDLRPTSHSCKTATAVRHILATTIVNRYPIPEPEMVKHSTLVAVGVLGASVFLPEPPRSDMEIKELTPILYVEAIEPVLPFWGDRLGFVILDRDGIEVMIQTRESGSGSSRSRFFQPQRLAPAVQPYSPYSITPIKSRTS